MDDTTKDLKHIQDSIHDIMISIKMMDIGDKKAKIELSLINVSKELNSLIIESITRPIEAQ